MLRAAGAPPASVGEQTYTPAGCHHKRNLNRYIVLDRSSRQAHLQRLGLKVIHAPKYSFTVPAGPDEYGAYY